MITFFHVGEDLKTPQMAVDSVLRLGMKCTVLTDEDTPAIKGADCVRFKKKGNGITHFRAHCYAEYNEPGIYLDTDMLVMRDLSPLMKLDFDVALTKRSGAIFDPSGFDVTQRMPYNAGFMAVKSKHFFDRLIKEIDQMSLEDQSWYCDQVGIPDAMRGLNCVELPINLFNRTIKQPDLDVSSAWVLHFKGRGKQFMESYSKELT